MKFEYIKEINHPSVQKYKGKYCVESASLLTHKDGFLEFTGSLVGDNFFKIGYDGTLLYINVSEREDELYLSGDVIGKLTTANFNNKSDAINLLKTILEGGPLKITPVSFNEILEFLGWTTVENFELYEFVN